MKNYLNRVLILLLSIVLLVPFFVYAADDETDEEISKAPITISMFRGEGCPHCEEALEWFDSIEEEYGDYFDLVTYEVWYDEDNATLMSHVGEYFSEDADGVPYIIIGEHTYSGFDSDDADTLIEYIMEEYEKDEEDRIDAVSDVISNIEGTSESNNVVVGVIIIVVIVGIVVVVIKARQE